MKKAFITGITGQDGHYLSKLLLEKDYEVHGTIRRSSSINTGRIDPLISKYQNTKQLNLYYSDLLDSSSLNMLINKIQPDETYNLAAQSHVAVSFKNPVFTTQTGTLGPLSLLEAVRNSDKEIKYYQASSSEMYGGQMKGKLNEESLLDPKSPYAAAKVFAHHMTSIYRDSYSLFCSNGILFNHESPHRGETFVTRKITRAATRIKLGLQKKLYVGNLNALRDWGHAKDFVEAQWLMLQQKNPEDFVIATGIQHSVRDFIELASKNLNMKIEWRGKGLEEVGFCNGKEIIKVDPRYFRPTEVQSLLGNPSKANKILKWFPKISFEQLVKEMIDKDLKLAQNKNR